MTKSAAVAKRGSGIIVGQTPWSARDALVPLFSRRIKRLPLSQAGQGSAAGAGVRPAIYAFRESP